MDQPQGSQLRISVLTSTDKSLDLRADLALVKAALLYADHVTLISPGAQYLSLSMSIIELVHPGWLAAHRNPQPQEAAQLLAGWSGPDDRVTQEELLRVAAGVHRIAESGDAAPALRWLADDPTIGELLLAHDMGILEIDDLGILSAPHTGSVFGMIKTPPGAMHPAGLATSMVERLMRVVGPSDDTIPMFDARVARQLARDDLGIDRSATRAATEAHLATSIISSMIVLPPAPMKEILDVRRELSEPLVRFRAALSEMAKGMQETPVDASFGRAVAAAYRTNVQPALLELEELDRQRGYRAQLARHLKRGDAIPDIEKTITLAATSYFMLPSLGVAAAGLAGTAASAAVKLATSVANDRDQLGQERRMNKFLFLPELRRRLNH